MNLKKYNYNFNFFNWIKRTELCEDEKSNLLSIPTIKGSSASDNFYDNFPFIMHRNETVLKKVLITILYWPLSFYTRIIYH